MLFLAVLALAFIKTSFGQDSAISQPMQLLASYYEIKDALITGNHDTVAAKAKGFIKTLNGIDYKIISEGNVNILLKDAGAISEANDIKKQRDFFTNLSSNMSALAKALEISDQAIYEMYCPMKDAYWLSENKEIRNPYYGESMMSCGKVVDTIGK